jgi:hypothetical protein
MYSFSFINFELSLFSLSFLSTLIIFSCLHSNPTSFLFFYNPQINRMQHEISFEFSSSLLLFSFHKGKTLTQPCIDPFKIPTELDS